MIDSCAARRARHGYVLDSAIVGGSDPIGALERALAELWAPGGPDTIVVCRAEEAARGNTCVIPAEPRGPCLFDEELRRFLGRRLGFALRTAAADDPLHAALARVAARTARRGTAVVLALSSASGDAPALADELSAAFFTQRRSGTLLVLLEDEGAPESVEVLRRSAEERSLPALAALLGNASRLAERAGAGWARNDAWGSAGFAWRGVSARARGCSNVLVLRREGHVEAHHRCSNERFELSEAALPLLMGASCDDALLSELLRRLDLTHDDEPRAELPSAFLYRRAARALRRARRDVPAYRDAVAFERVPVVTPRQIEARWSSYNRGGLSLREIVRKPRLVIRGSSGTTGGISRASALEQAVRFERADAENLLFGRVETPRIVVLNRPGNLFAVPIGFDEVRVHRETAEQLRVAPGLNPTTTQPAAWEKAYEAIAAFAPESIQADANYLIGLGLFMRRRGVSLPTVGELILGYNFAWAFQRRLLVELFGARLVDMYHSGEGSAMGISCPLEALHLLECHALYEVVRERRHARAGELGVLVLSTLDTRLRPLLRYAIGDVVRLVGAGCPCGRPGRVISFEGRIRYLFEDGRGRLATTRDVDKVLASARGAAFAQVRKTDEGLTLGLVRCEGGSGTVDAELRAAFEEAFALPTRVRWVDALPLASPNGKVALMDVPDQQARFLRRLLFGEGRAPRGVRWSLARSAG